MGFNGDLMEIPSGELTVCELERSTMLLMGRLGHFPLQTVSLPEGIFPVSRGW